MTVFIALSAALILSVHLHKKFYNIDRDNLRATYSVKFNNWTMYNAFRYDNDVIRNSAWSVQSNYIATFRFET